MSGATNTKEATPTFPSQESDDLQLIYLKDIKHAADAPEWFEDPPLTVCEDTEDPLHPPHPHPISENTLFITDCFPLLLWFWRQVGQLSAAFIRTGLEWRPPETSRGRTRGKVLHGLEKKAKTRCDWCSTVTRKDAIRSCRWKKTSDEHLLPFHSSSPDHKS